MNDLSRPEWRAAYLWRTRCPRPEALRCGALSRASDEQPQPAYGRLAVPPVERAAERSAPAELSYEARIYGSSPDA